MKKSFILSLVMVVVLIASLATATYAWYTSQVQVNTSVVTLTTAGAGKTIVISGAKITESTFTNKIVNLTMDANADSIQPMIPAANPSGLTVNTLTFKTLSVTDTNKVAGLGDGTASKLVTVENAADALVTNSNGMIFVANPGAEASNYTVKVVIDADLETPNSDATNKGLRVAVFKYNTDFDSDDSAPANANGFVLLGIWAPASETVGYQSSAIENGDSYDPSGKIITGKETKIAISANDSTVVYASNTPAAAGNLAGIDGTTIDNDIFTVVTWFEGTNVTNAYQGKEAKFQIYFDLA